MTPFCILCADAPIIARWAYAGFCPSQDDATVKCWGGNGYGQLGQGDSNDRGDNSNGSYPNLPPHSRRLLIGADSHVSPRAEMGTNLPAVDLGPGRTAVSVSAGSWHTCAVLVTLHFGENSEWATSCRQQWQLLLLRAGRAMLFLTWLNGVGNAKQVSELRD